MLERARDAAEAASRAKSAFLANTSHEIRTPLNGLLGLARLALRDDLPEAQRKTYVAHILDSAQGLSATLSDMLDLSKIEAGKLDLEATPFRLHAALDAVRHAICRVAQAKGLSLELQVDPALPAVVRGDAARVRQIVGNFVSNAIKFTERGSVRIDATAQGHDGGALRGDRHRHRHRRGRAGPLVPAVHAGRRVDHAALRRHRPRPVDLPRSSRA